MRAETAEDNQADNVDGISGIQAPDAPDSPAEPNQPIDPDLLINLTNAQDTQRERLSREREIDRVEKVAGRSLTEQEREVTLPQCEENLDAIDQRSVEILNRYQNLTHPNRWQRAGLFLARTIGRGAVAVGLRTLVRATPLGFMAGTITGGILGSVFGALRGYQTEMKSHFGAGAVRQEYEKIKQESPDNPEVALAFLQSVLEGRGDRSDVIGTELADQGQQGGMRYAATRTLRSAGQRAESWLIREQGYQGDLSGLLELITFYRNEARGLYPNQENNEQIQQVDRHLLESLSAPGQGLRENYRDHARHACRNAMKKGALKGLLIGAGVGAVSDVISWFAGNLRAEGAQRAYVADQQSPDNALHAQFQDQPGEWLSKAQEHFYDHGLSRQTDFGNSLSSAMETSLNNPGSSHLVLPDNLQDQLGEWVKNGGSQDSFIRQITEPFHFATPLPEHEYFYHGQDLQFNYRALQEILDNTYRGVDMTTRTFPENFFETIQNADQVLSVDFPQRIAEEATQAGVQAATHEPFAQSLLHGAGIGIGATYGVDKKVKAENPSTSGGSGGGVAGGGERGSGSVDRAEDNGGATAEPPVAAPAEDINENSLINPELVELPESAPPEEDLEIGTPNIDWVQLLTQHPTNKQELTGRAKYVLGKLGRKGWSAIKAEDRGNVLSLFGFLTGNDQIEKVVMEKGGENLVLQAISEDGKTLILQSGQQLSNHRATLIDITNPDQTRQLKLNKIDIK